MKFATVIMSLASLLFASGCASSKTILVGGERRLFYAAGTDVPGVNASDNKDGIFQLTAGEMNAILNP